MDKLFLGKFYIAGKREGISIASPTRTRLRQLYTSSPSISLKDNRASEIHYVARVNIACREEGDPLSTMSCLSSHAEIFMRARAFRLLNYLWKEWGTSRSLHTNVKIFKSCNLLHEKLQHLHLFEVWGELAYSG